MDQAAAGARRSEGEPLGTDVEVQVEEGRDAAGTGDEHGRGRRRPIGAGTQRICEPGRGGAGESGRDRTPVDVE